MGISIISKIRCLDLPTTLESRKQKEEEGMERRERDTVAEEVGGGVGMGRIESATIALLPSSLPSPASRDPPSTILLHLVRAPGRLT